MKLFLIRHGEPDYENDCLTALGRKQAEAICMLKDREQITQVICSPLGRARETAEPLSACLHVETEIRDWLKEIDDITIWSEKRPDLAIWNARSKILYDWEKEGRVKEQPFAERLEEKKQALAEGMDAVLRLRGIRKDTFGCQVTKEKAEKGDLAIVCHLGVGLLLLSCLLDLSPYTVFRSFFLAPASITTVLLEEYGDGKAGFRILQMGDVSHMVSQGIEVVRSGLQYNID